MRAHRSRKSLPLRPSDPVQICRKFLHYLDCHIGCHPRKEGNSTIRRPSTRIFIAFTGRKSAVSRGYIRWDADAGEERDGSDRSNRSEPEWVLGPFPGHRGLSSGRSRNAGPRIRRRIRSRGHRAAGEVCRTAVRLETRHEHETSPRCSTGLGHPRGRRLLATPLASRSGHRSLGRGREPARSRASREAWGRWNYLEGP